MKRRKPKSARKELVIRVRVTADQRTVLTQAAEKRGLALSTWMLMTALDEAKRGTEDAPGAT